MSNPVLTWLAIFLSTGFYSSYVPALVLNCFSGRKSVDNLKEKKWTGAGLIGTLIGAVTYLWLPFKLVNSFCVLGIFGILAVFASQIAERHFQVKDDSRIIIDEWVGSWIAFFGLPQVINWPFVLAFILFRLFDVWKGPLVRPLQRLPGGWGIVLDDVAAGLLAFFTVFLLRIAFFL